MGVLALTLMLAAVLQGTFFTGANRSPPPPPPPPQTWWTIGPWKPKS
jgi:hypothetical protein